MYQHFIEGLQRLGRALMLPIAILPIAGLLLRLGDTDLLNIAVMHDAGQAIFANLALIFAIGIAVGFARDNNGTAGLAGAIGYLVMISTLKVMDTTINMGMLAGIASGLMAGALYNRFKDIKLPEYLAFFGGRRFVPIVTGFSAVGLGVVFGLIWPPIQHGINSFGVLLMESGSLGASYNTGGDATWTVVTGQTHDGSYAARSGTIGSYDATWLTRTVEGNEVGFWYRVSSEDGYDFFDFYIDNDRELRAGRHRRIEYHL